jgi:hypothetical protein
MSKTRRNFCYLDSAIVNSAIKEYCSQGHTCGVSVSIDGGYFILEVDGKVLFNDSECEECYTIQGAIGLFTELLRHYPDS